MTSLGDRVWRLVPAALAGLTGVLPALPVAVVFGQPSSEGNAVEIVRGLIDLKYRGAIVWLNAPSEVYPELPVSRRIRRVSKSSLQALVAYVFAEVVFYTHALYGGPRLSPTRTVVNLWHGDGPKRVSSPGHMSYFMAGTEVYGNKHRRQFGLSEGQMIVAGNARTDQFLMPSSPSALSVLGIDPDQPFVVWMPTYRVAGNADRSAFRDPIVDVAELEGEQSLTSMIERGFAVLRQSGIAIVTRAHPLDEQARIVSGGIDASDRNLDAAGLSLYQLLGSSSGLISDYSSVMTDFLLLDRPIGVYAPDAQDYLATRGLDPAESMSTLLPGELLSEDEDFQIFAREVLEGSSSGVRKRAEVRRALGVAELGGAAHRVIEFLAGRQSLKLRTSPGLGRARA